MKHHGAISQIHDRERSLCEAFRIDPSGPTFSGALKRYIKLGKPNAERILEYDRAPKADVLTHLRRALADG